MREAVEGCREVLGAQHPDTLLAVNNLAGLLQDQDRLAEAEPLYREAVKGSREPLGAGHADTLDAVENLPSSSTRRAVRSVAPNRVGREHRDPGLRLSGPSGERTLRAFEQTLRASIGEEVSRPRLAADPLGGGGSRADDSSRPRQAGGGGHRGERRGGGGAADGRPRRPGHQPGKHKPVARRKSPGNKPPSPLKMAMAGVSEYLKMRECATVNCILRRTPYPQRRHRRAEKTHSFRPLASHSAMHAACTERPQPQRQ